MTSRFEELTHLVYEASLDNSLWPELISELVEEVHRARDSRYLESPNQMEAETRGFENLSRHFRRAFSISERVVGLQEREAYLSSILNSFAFGVALLNEEGQVLMANSAMHEVLPTPVSMGGEVQVFLPKSGEERGLSRCAEEVNRTGKALEFQSQKDGAADIIILPREDAARIGFPSIAASVVMSSGQQSHMGADHLAKQHGLTRREAEVLRHMGQSYDLREAARRMGISYESVRTYLKRVYGKTNTNSRSEVAALLAQSPLVAVRSQDVPASALFQVRNRITLSDGRQHEYFVLGPQDGAPVLVFDALSGVTIDVIGYPQRCYDMLAKNGVRLICPCRPGSFWSDPSEMSSLRDFASDVRELLDHFGIAKAGVLSVSFGSGSALAVTHELQDRISKVVLSSASYPFYRHENWRELDQFYHMSCILGRHWPSMLRQIIPFLVRSILQNKERYFDRYCRRSRSADDIRILSCPVIRRRTAEMLALRTASGMEGMVEENLLNAQGWDFDPSDIRTPVEIFQGPDDNVAPVQGAELLQQHLHNATLTILEGKGHYHHIENWPWLAARAAGKDIGQDALRYDIPEF
ncbi:alpha/beta fold hydrolase [uncultured Shimia sp.]|uniref:alpha/beta fold hydrolase n=1 Tax=uncultured Shimia sp. TaxID=573152 RepID=UPI0025E6A9D0|nr:alpha/beta fold hydrolase [uncultured Shimia sp.]